MVIAVLPVVVATAIAGTVTNPSGIRPCAKEYSKGIRGGPLHVALGPDGKLYATESFGDRILRFDPDTHATAEFPVPRGTAPHDIVTGPDGNLWFAGNGDALGMLDLKTRRVTMFPGVTPGSQPHDVAWLGGYLYFSELQAGHLGRFDPKTRTIQEGLWGLPPGNQIHGLAVADGYIWAALSNANRLARFNPATKRFDRFVTMPIADAGPRSVVFLPSRHALYFSLFAANQLARYELRTGKVTLYPTPIERVPLSVAENLNARREKVAFVGTDARQRYIWASTLSGELLRLDLNTSRIKRVHCGISFPAVTGKLTTDGDGRLWFVEAFPGRIARINP